MFPAKRVVGTCCAIAFFAGTAWCGDGEGDRWFFPRNSVRGYVDFQVAPPHNEVDMGMCYIPEESTRPLSTPCSAYARYVWSGYVEVQPIGRGVFRRLFFFAEPKLFGGNNVPQVRYTASAAPILWERLMGVGVELRSGLELRLTHHMTNMVGRYKTPLKSPEWRTDGPYGLYTTVGVRWYFGGYGKAPGRGQ